MEGLPGHAPALTFAAAVLKRADRTGRRVAATEPDLVAGWDAESIGDALLAVVAAARQVGVDAEVALRQAAARLRDDVAGPGR